MANDTQPLVGVVGEDVWVWVWLKCDTNDKRHNAVGCGGWHLEHWRYAENNFLEGNGMDFVKSLVVRRSLLIIKKKKINCRWRQ